MGQWIANNIQFLIFAAFLLFSGLGWVAKQLNEQAEKKRARQQRERMMHEALRTGRLDAQPQPVAFGASAARPAPGSAEDAKERLRRLAEQRRSEMRDARERGARPAPSPTVLAGPAGSPARPGGSGRAPTSRTQFPQPPAPPPPPAPRAPARPGFPGSPARPEPSQPTRQRQTTSTSDRSGGRSGRDVAASARQAPEDAQRAARAQRERAEEGMSLAMQGATRRAASDRSAAADARARAADLTILTTNLQDRASLRRAILLSEVLAPPVSMRQPGAPASPGF